LSNAQTGIIPARVGCAGGGVQGFIKLAREIGFYFFCCCPESLQQRMFLKGIRGCNCRGAAKIYPPIQKRLCSNGRVSDNQFSWRDFPL